MIRCTAIPNKYPDKSTMRFFLIIFGILILLAGCLQSRSVVIEQRSTQRNREIEEKLREEITRWIGTPHRLGGNGKSGIDCSGFAVRIYGDLFNLRLPRSTKEQVKTGVPLSRDDLRPGDLAFFKPSFGKRHVGIYLGNGEFAHVSSTAGVAISNIDDRFWAGVYWTARRILW